MLQQDGIYILKNNAESLEVVNGFHSLSPRLYSVNNQKHEITAKPPNYKISKSSLFTTPFLSDFYQTAPKNKRTHH